MEQRHSRETNLFPASDEIPKILWNLNAQYRVRKYPPHVTILSQINPFHVPLPIS